MADSQRGRKRRPTHVRLLDDIAGLELVSIQCALGDVVTVDEKRGILSVEDIDHGSTAIAALNRRDAMRVAQCLLRFAGHRPPIDPA